MATGVEELGAAVEGGLLARAVEPRAGEPRHDGHTAERACLNCGTALAGGFCHACGQHAHVHRTLGAFGHDLLHGVLHFEGKIWRTLPLLLWRPGELTRRYVEGERARFVSPLALFLFCVFLMFASIAALGGGPEPDSLRNTHGEVRAALRHARADLADLERPPIGPEESPAASFRAGMVDSARNVRRASSAASAEELQARIADARRTVAHLRAAEQAARRAGGVESIAVSDDTPFNAGLAKMVENPALAFYKAQNNGYKFSWLLIPMSVPFMWLLFPFSRRHHLYDHAVFVTYSLCFMTLLFVAVSAMHRAGSPSQVNNAVLFVLPTAHLYRQLKGAYRLRWWSAALRTALLLLVCGAVLAAFVVILITLGALG